MPQKDIPKEILSIMEKARPVLGEPVYTYSMTNVMIARETTNPYIRISRLLSAIAQFAYAVALHQAQKKGWHFRELPESPVQITVREGSLPNNILDGIVENVEMWALTYIDGIARNLEEGIGVYVDANIRTIPLEAIIALSRRKETIEDAVSELLKTLEVLKREAGMKYTYHVQLTYHDGVPEELLHRGYKEFRVISGTHHETDFEKFKEITEKMGYELRESTLGNLRHVIARKTVGDVEIWIDCDSKGFGFIIVSFVDTLPKIPTTTEYPVEIENVTITPLEFKKGEVPLKKMYMVRKVQRIGTKLALYLTKPLEAIGVSEGDEVEIEVDLEGNEIKIRPIKNRL